MQLRIVVTGASGQLGAYVLDRLGPSGHEVIGWSRSSPGHRSGFPIEQVDLLDLEAISRAIERDQPDTILHLGAISSVDQAFRDPETAFAVNARATGFIAARADVSGCRVVYASTDMVFDGVRGWREEEDDAEPISTYGASKKEGERQLFLPYPSALNNAVVRLSLLYGPSRIGKPTTLDRVFDALRAGQRQAFFVDEFRTPLDYATAADAIVRMAEEREHSGVFHLGGIERLTRFEMIGRLALHEGLPVDLIGQNRQEDVPAPEPRPRDISLDSSKIEAALRGLSRPTLEAGLDRCRAEP
ncbi:SDR family oxidoreductase [Tautonia marina]|uniref:SDR family oxidoreductase n=1 Tax=Tautonia marina TaxID=2653855 RepID=UPI0012607625|nr:SDR family oxidoreductase [Tautonia marina]